MDVSPTSSDQHISLRSLVWLQVMKHGLLTLSPWAPGLRIRLRGFPQPSKSVVRHGPPLLTRGVPGLFPRRMHELALSGIIRNVRSDEKAEGNRAINCCFGSEGIVFGSPTYLSRTRPLIPEVILSKTAKQDLKEDVRLHSAILEDTPPYLALD